MARNPDAAWVNNAGDVEIGPKGAGPFFIDVDGITEAGPFATLNEAILHARGTIGSGAGKKIA